MTFVALGLLGAARAAPRQPVPFGVDDYFQLHRVVELDMSASGDWLAYAVEVPVLDENKTRRAVYLVSLSGQFKTIPVRELSDARELAWISNGQELAFISDRAGPPQVFSYDRETGAVEQRTRSREPVVRFQFAPRGPALAYITVSSNDERPTLLTEFANRSSGIVVDTEVTSLYDFVNPDYRMSREQTRTLHLAANKETPATSLEIPGNVSEFFWAPDGRRLSVEYSGHDNAASFLRAWRNSIGIVDAATREFLSLAKAYPSTTERPGVSFTGGEWVAGQQKVFIRRFVEGSPWAHGVFPEWTIAEVSHTLSKDSAWISAESYPENSRFFPVDASTILTENTIQGTRSLFVWSDRGMERSDRMAGIHGSNSRFAFDADLNRMAFVNEGLTSPPEVYVRLGRKAPIRQLTWLNLSAREKLLPSAREIEWRSSDGTAVHGWLLESPAVKRGSKSPLVVFVHGGPCYAYTNSFAPYFSRWPYPLEAYASRGIAVFIPNYRGTCSYGKSFTLPKGVDAEPLADIVSGVQHLIRMGIADPGRLGISGHSHGAWLASLAITRFKVFRAASIAEGSLNNVVTYELMPGLHNREVSDVVNGGSLYDVPQRYIDLSPDLHFKGLTTACLFESGARSAPLLMFGMGKAARRAGAAIEFVVYPRTEHNITEPRLQRDAAQRNLDWFDTWLNGRKSR